VASCVVTAGCQMPGHETIAVMELFLVLVAAATVLAVATRRLPLLPYSVGLVVIGVAVSALELPLDLEIAPDLLLAVLIPGLVFEAAYRLDLRDLVPNLPAIGLLATVGVLVTAGTVAAILNLVTGLDFGLAFLVGTMLAATDPAAVVAVFSRLRAPRRLTTLVEAESLFNDGTGIVIFAIAIEAFGREVPLIELVGGLVVTVVVSILLGAGVGLLATRLLSRIEDHLIELTISLVAAYGSYLLAERLDQSGILASVMCGLIFGSLGRRATSPRAEDAIDTVWEFIAFLLTTLVFLLIGLAISIPQLLNAALLSLLALIGLLLSRGLVVYGLLGMSGRVLERIGWGRAVPTTWLHLIAWAGLRGAIAVALALSLPAGIPNRDLLQGAVFGCVLLTLLLQGTTADPLVRRLGIEVRDAGGEH
jgi:CPA1 family monovalent cation:H+ antiporter